MCLQNVLRERRSLISPTLTALIPRPAAPLTPQDVRAIAEKFIARLNERLAGQSLRLTLDESVYALLMKGGYSPAFGARPMERAIAALIAQPLAKTILEGRVDPGTELLARVSGAEVSFAEELDGTQPLPGVAIILRAFLRTAGLLACGASRRHALRQARTPALRSAGVPPTFPWSAF